MKKIALILSASIFFFVSVYGLEISINGVDKDESSPGNYEDNYSFKTNNNSNIYIVQEDEDSLGYDSGLRSYITQGYDFGSDGYDSYVSVGTGLLVSELYGDFYLRDGSILLKEDTVLNSNCENVSYYYTGSLYSPSFGKLQINDTENNYFCPITGSSSIDLSSDLLGDIVIGGGVINLDNFNLVDVFDDKKITIIGSQNLDNRSGLESLYSEDKSIYVDSNISQTKLEIKRTIEKNIVKYTRGLTPVTTENYILNGLSDGNANPNNKNIFYYDLSSNENVSPSNGLNKGDILTLGTGGVGINLNRMVVANHRLLYVKGGNLYINADIYNSTDISKLVIYVTRDDSNRENGGNVYIDPNVTNIDAVIIAEGSVLSYSDIDGVLNADDNEDSLRRQLHIYGSLYSSNTFGLNEAPYGSDGYISNNGETLTGTGLYNFETLRSFQPILNDDVSGVCGYTGETKLTALDSGTGALTYAFSGKKQCFSDDTVQDGLRGSNSYSPVVIEYNPSLQTNPHFILKQ